MTIPADEFSGLLLRSDHVDMCLATNQGGYDQADALDIALTMNVIAEDAVAWKCSSSQEQKTPQRYIATLISSQCQDQTVSSRVVQATCCATRLDTVWSWRCDEMSVAMYRCGVVCSWELEHFQATASSAITVIVRAISKASA